MKKAANTLTNVGLYRNVKLTMDDETAASYIDTDSNFVFRDIFLEETAITPTRKIKEETEKSSLDMEKILETFQKRDKRDIEEINFSIKQFGGTHKATYWISEYKEECRKYKNKSDEEKVKGLKNYLEKTAANWYETNLLKAEGYNSED